MSGYYLWGLISSAFFLSSIPATFHQLRVILKRKRLKSVGALTEEVTQSISVNQIFSSFCGSYSFFLFGLVLDAPDPFLTIPRALSCCLMYLIIIELYRDRGSLPAKSAFSVCSLLLLVPFFLLLSGTRSSLTAQSASNGVVCVATVLMAQGSWSQFMLLRRSRLRGAVSLPMHVTLYAKDFSGMMFGFEIGYAAWSIILMHASNLIMRAPVIYSYLRLSR